jgi:hypothetical protein
MLRSRYDGRIGLVENLKPRCGGERRSKHNELLTFLLLTLAAIFMNLQKTCPAAAAPARSIKEHTECLFLLRLVHRLIVVE